MNYSHILLLFLLQFLICTSEWKVSILKNSNKQIQSFSVRIQECQHDKTKIINNLQHTTICTNTNYPSYSNGYLPFDTQYSICYRYFQKNLNQAKNLTEKAFKMISLSLREKDLFIDDILQSQFTVEFCGKQQLSYFKIQKPVTTSHKIQEKLGKQVQEISIQETFGTFSKRISGKGFHQHLNYTITPPLGIDLNSQQCSVTIEDVLPQSTYVDVDQLMSYGIVQSNQVINIEKPVYMSKQYTYRFKFGFGQLRQLDPNNYNYLQPIHFRYARPSKTQSVQVNIHPTENMLIECKGKKYIIKQDRDIYRGVGKIPVGDSSKTSVVSMVTFISEIICALMLVKNLRK